MALSTKTDKETSASTEACLTRLTSSGGSQILNCCFPATMNTSVLVK